MRKPRQDLDEPISLHPLTGEQVLRRLLGADGEVEGRDDRETDGGNEGQSQEEDDGDS